MIYVCIPSYDEAPTVGLLLWKIRQVFAAFPREYQLLVLDDGSSDATREVLEPYARVLPLTVVRHAERKGYAASVEALFRRAVDLTDRPKRDTAILMHADFAHNPQIIPDLVRRIESGADMVVAEGRLSTLTGSTTANAALTVPGVKDLVSGFAAIRLVALRNAIRSQSDRLLLTDGWAANAELYWRAGRYARRVETVTSVERHDLRSRSSRVRPWETAMGLWSARRTFRASPVPPATPEPTPRREVEAQAVSP